eukprot:CAMPEP_0195031346 /NCGR_PEP_ID=MMETSP0326_2-20130528/61008_1 /TAXON_ID=2866 ORGANISM="Crypthecodinium cohnii, Strain Seligo" /NCGR_SAMPLE_ID=MMETSP0326_2 /ASSEMBLY_ACC=CAM_ASM_000348 /LENGTH=130 /DNA_ID=CAMNT_0040055023 /DNA_START=61 /DNA_END=450 /DNA_ORIENTATION=+
MKKCRKQALIDQKGRVHELDLELGELQNANFLGQRKCALLPEGEEHQQLHTDEFEQWRVAPEDRRVGMLHDVHVVDGRARCKQASEAKLPKVRGVALKVGRGRAKIPLPQAPTGLDDANHDEHRCSEPHK